MSWSDLVARLVREAVDRHDPSRGGRGQRRRQSASSASEPPAGPPAARRCAGAARDARPTAGSATPAPECETRAAVQRRHPVPVSLSEVPPRAAAALPPAQSGPPASDRTGVAAASAAAPVPQSAPGTSARDHPVQAAAAPAPAGTPASQSAPDTSPAGNRTGAATGTAPRARGRAWPAASRRAIPAAVRRLVWQRDQGRCCYRDPISGRRCTSAHLLQLDHLLPVAQGGGADPENLRLVCSAHHRQRHRGVPVTQPEGQVPALPRRRGGTADRRLMEGRTAPAPPSAQHSGRIAGYPLSCHRMGSHPIPTYRSLRFAPRLTLIHGGIWDADTHTLRSGSRASPASL